MCFCFATSSTGNKLKAVQNVYLIIPISAKHYLKNPYHTTTFRSYDTNHLLHMYQTVKFVSGAYLWNCLVLENNSPTKSKPVKLNFKNCS
jgi:hypothetical protein